MRGVDYGHRGITFFPAESSDSISALKSFGGLFAGVRFCPTGGIDAGRAPACLALPNVFTVGGSWIVPTHALDARDGMQSPSSRVNALCWQVAVGSHFLCARTDANKIALRRKVTPTQSSP